MIIFVLLYQPLENGDFEDWTLISGSIPFAWDTIGNGGAECQWLLFEGAKAGDYSIKVSNSNDVSGFDCAIVQSRYVSPNTTYDVRFHVVDTSTGMGARVFVRCFEDDGSLIDSSDVGSYSMDSPSWQWQAIGGTYTTPSTCSYLEVWLRYYGAGSIHTDVAYVVSSLSGSSLVESFDSYVPDEWIEVDVGIPSEGFFRRRTSACPFNDFGDDSCLGIKYLPSSTDSDLDSTGLFYLMTDTLDFITQEPETLIFFWRTNYSSGDLNPEDSITLEVSTDDGNSWERIWKWDGIPDRNITPETVALNLLNYESQVLLRFAFYKNSTTSSVGSNRYFNVDSVKVLNSLVGRYNRITNASFEQWLLDTRDAMPDYWRRKITENPSSSIAQIWIKKDSINTFSGNYSAKVYYTTTRIPYLEQGIPNPFTSGCRGHPRDEIDSFLVEVSTRFYDNDSQGKARMGVVWYSGASSVGYYYTSNYTTNSTSWQLFEISDTLSQGPSSGVYIDSITLRIRFYNEGSSPNAEEGATIYVDSIDLNWYCFVDDVLPVDVAEVPVGSQFIQYVRHYGNFLEIAVKKPLRVEIYDVRGRRVVHRFVRDRVSFRLRSGIYMIRAGDVRKKILLVE